MTTEETLPLNRCSVGWRTAWTDSPGRPGAVRLCVVNLRFECRKAKWGWKLQVTGEALVTDEGCSRTPPARVGREVSSGWALHDSGDDSASRVINGDVLQEMRGSIGWE